MITSIIFDLGNVLINWKPTEFLENNGFPDKEKELILRDIFNSKEWLMIDNGDISTLEAIERIASRSSLSKSKIKAVFDLRLKIITPIEQNIKLLPELKKRGYRLYFLSNFPDDIFDEVRNKYKFFNLFDGGEISARLNASKPSKKIFRLFLSRYSLKPEECIFIDDSEQNAYSARKIGIISIHLVKPELLKEKLEEILNLPLLSN